MSEPSSGTVVQGLFLTGLPGGRIESPRRMFGWLVVAVLVLAVFLPADYLRRWGLEYSPSGGDRAILTAIA